MTNSTIVKTIDIKCFNNGSATLTTPDLHLEGENLASLIKVDFSETTYKDAEKYIDIVNGKYQARHRLGTAEVVEYALDYKDTVPGTMIITPIAAIGEQKVKYKCNYNLTITRLPDVTTEIRPDDVGDYLISLQRAIDDRLEKRVADDDSTYVYAYDKNGQKQINADELGGSSAEKVAVDTSEFNNLLSQNADTLQKALNELDQAVKPIDALDIINLFK